jgi:hypothetical protein
MNLKKIIKEELEGDWSWTQEYPNIWISYQLLLFDETPTKGEVIKFINDAFNSGLVSSEAIDSWRDEGVENESGIIYNDALMGESPYLRIDLNDGWLYYGTGYQYVVNNYPELRKINFSEAKNYSINESTGFEWIDDITPEDIKFKVGDTIKVKNIGNERSFIDWLGDYGGPYNRGEYGWYIVGVVSSVGQETFTLIEVESRNRISFPNPDKFNIFRVDHKDLDLSYEILNTNY